jgi:hypothetical protein
MSNLVWSYGVTTHPKRLSTTLPKTLESLAITGFDNPHLFIDGYGQNQTKLRTTLRSESIGAYGNWILAAWSLYLEKPKADRYAIFQDDILLCKGVRQYLNQSSYPANSYLNLFAFGPNEHKIFGKSKGWCKSDQLGHGGVALVFDHLAMITLLKQTHTVNKPQLDGSGNKNPKANLDGTVSQALINQARFVEYVHNPSLVKHIGTNSVIGNAKHPEAKTFPGVNANILEIMKSESH